MTAHERMLPNEPYFRIDNGAAFLLAEARTTGRCITPEDSLDGLLTATLISYSVQQVIDKIGMEIDIVFGQSPRKKHKRISQFFADCAEPLSLAQQEAAANGRYAINELDILVGLAQSNNPFLKKHFSEMNIDKQELIQAARNQQQST